MSDEQATPAAEPSVEGTDHVAAFKRVANIVDKLSKHDRRRVLNALAMLYED